MLESVVIVIGLSKVVAFLTHCKVLKDMSCMRFQYNKQNRTRLR